MISRTNHPNYGQAEWLVYVRDEAFAVKARDIDSARSAGMMAAMQKHGLSLRDVFCATPSDRIQRLT